MRPADCQGDRPPGQPRRSSQSLARVLPHPVPHSAVPSLGKSVSHTRLSQTSQIHMDKSAVANSAILKGWWLFFFSLCFKICHIFCPVISQDDDKSFRRAPSWRKKFRPKDVRGLAAGSAETLPANFRVPSSLSSPSVQPRKVQPDGRWLVGQWVRPGPER